MAYDAEIADLILDRIELGTYDYVAAEECGLDPSEWQEWLRRTDEPYVKFQKEWRKACAMARADAEKRLHKRNPEKWLKLGPGKSAPGRPGWSERVEYSGPDGGAVQIATTHTIDYDLFSLEEIEEFNALERRRAELIAKASPGKTLPP